MNRRGGLLALGLSLIGLTSASAAEFLDYAWPDGSLHISTGDLDVTRPKPGNWQDAFETAAGRWNSPTLVTVTTDTNTATADCESAGPNSTFFSDNFCGRAWGSSTLATARTLYFTSGPKAGQADHTDVAFNSTKNWVIDDGGLAGSQVDFTRVAVHEMGHSLGLDHPPDPNAIMYFQESDTISPQTDDVFGINRVYGAETDQIVSVADLNGNGAGELGVVLLDSNGNYVLNVRDGRSGANIRRVNLGPHPLIAIAISPDASGNGVEEVVALARLKNGSGRLQAFDLDTKAMISEVKLSAGIRWVDVAVSADTDGGGLPDMIAVGLNSSDAAKAKVYDIATGSSVINLGFGAAKAVIGIHAVPDSNGDLLPEYAALILDSTDRALVIVRSGADGSSLARLAFGRSFAPLAFVVGEDTNGNGAPEIIELGKDDTDKLRVLRRDVNDSNYKTKTVFGAPNRPIGLVAMGDVTGDGVADHGIVLQKDGEDPRIQILDGTDTQSVGSVAFKDIGQGQDVVAVAGAGSGAGPLVAVVGNRFGDFRSETRDIETGKRISEIDYPLN